MLTTNPQNITIPKLLIGSHVININAIETIINGAIIFINCIILVFIVNFMSGLPLIASIICTDKSICKAVDITIPNIPASVIVEFVHLIIINNIAINPNCIYHTK